MAVDDRDWYKDAIRKREAKENAHYYPKQFRGGKRPPPIPQYKPDATPPAPPPPSKPAVHWTLMLMFWAALLIIGMAIARHFR